MTADAVSHPVLDNRHENPQNQETVDCELYLAVKDSRVAKVTCAAFLYYSHVCLACNCFLYIFNMQLIAGNYCFRGHPSSLCNIICYIMVVVQLMVIEELCLSS